MTSSLDFHAWCVQQFAHLHASFFLICHSYQLIILYCISCSFTFDSLLDLFIEWRYNIRYEKFLATNCAQFYHKYFTFTCWHSSPFSINLTSYWVGASRLKTSIADECSNTSNLLVFSVIIVPVCITELRASTDIFCV